MKNSTISLIVLFFTTSLFAQGVWTTKSNYGGGPTYRSTATTLGNKAYVGVGSDKSDFWEYDPITDTWTQRANFSDIYRDWAISFAIGDKVYVGFGFGNIGNCNDLWEYNPITNVWTQKASLGGVDTLGMPISARVGAVGFSINGKGYVGLGDNAGPLNDFHEYNPISNSWIQKNPFPGPARFGASSFTIGDKAYVIFGTGNTFSYNDFWEYDPLTDTWTEKTPFPGLTRRSAVAFSIGTKAYIGSGNTVDSPYCSDDFFCWDQTTDTWTPVTSYPGGLRQMGIAFSLNGKGYVGTGASCPVVKKSDMWEFDPSCYVAAPHICMVTTDSATLFKYNIIYWDKSLYSNVDSFLVYRKDALSSNYFHLGSVAQNAPGFFIDSMFHIGGPNGGNPRFSSWYYKLAIRDTCGLLSEKSPYHQTMFVQQNYGNFSWNAYTVESGQTNQVIGYSFLRDDYNNGNWQVLVTPSGLSTTDPDYINYPDGNWRLDALGFSCNMYSKSMKTLSHSNTTKQVLVDTYPNFEIIHDESICPGEVYDWRGNSYSIAGTYYDSLTTQYGQDSVFVLNLILHPSYTFTDTANICFGDTLHWRGSDYHATGFYYDSLNTIHGCDSVFILDLTVNPFYFIVETDTLCTGDTIIWRGQNYWAGGIYFDSLLTVTGCDSVYSLNLSQFNVYNYVTYDTICQGGSYTWQDNTYTNTGTYYNSFTSHISCDSSYVLHLTVSPIYSIVKLDTICSGDVYNWQGNNYTSAGFHYAHLQTTHGCDSMLYLALYAHSLPLVNINLPDTFFCDYHAPVSISGTPAGGTFSGQGVSANIFDPAMAGTGTWQITYTYPDSNACENSATITVLVDACVGLLESGDDNIKLYPNPNDGNFIIELQEETYITVYNTLGAVVYESIFVEGTNVFHLNNLANGVYYIKAEGQKLSEVLRVVIQK